MESLIIGRKARSRALLSIPFFILSLYPFIFWIYEKNYIIIFAIFPILIGVLIIKKAKYCYRLVYTLKERKVYVYSKKEKTEIDLMDIKNIENGSSIIDKYGPNYTFYYLTTLQKKEYMFSIQNKDLEAINNLHQLKKQVILIRHQRAKNYAQIKRQNIT